MGKAGHHGSDTSNTQAFVEAIDPEWVVYSAGRDNQFDHPSASVVSRYMAAGATAICTDVSPEDDTVTMMVDCNSGEITWSEIQGPIIVASDGDRDAFADGNSHRDGDDPGCAARYVADEDSCNRGDFNTWPEAQAFHEFYDPDEVNGLDADGDGDVCENLAGYPG